MSFWKAVGSTLVDFGKYAIQEGIPNLIEKNDRELLKRDDLSEEMREKIQQRSANAKVSTSSKLKDVERKIVELELKIKKSVEIIHAGQLTNEQCIALENEIRRCELEINRLRSEL